MIDLTKLYTVKEVARTLGRGESTVRLHAAKFNIGSKVGRQWLFSDDDVTALKQIKPRRGRPPILS